MVMTLCLMVYAAIQHRIRYELKRQSRTFPDMKKKPAQNPTARWVFLLFFGHSCINGQRDGETCSRYLGESGDNHLYLGVNIPRNLFLIWGGECRVMNSLFETKHPYPCINIRKV